MCVFGSASGSGSADAKLSFLGVAALASKKHDMMRVFVNRSARQRGHVGVGGHRVRRCGSAGVAYVLGP